MCPADERASPRRAEGFTFLEVATVTALLGLATLAVEQTIDGVTSAERLLRSVRNTAVRCQRALYDLREIVFASRKVYQDDALGNGYLAKVDLGRFPRFAGSRLPTIDDAAPLGPDEPNRARTGNVLLFVREADPTPCVVSASKKKVRLIDTYRLVCAYLSESPRVLVTGTSPALDLVIWRSKAYPSYAQVMSISDAAQRRRVVKDLYLRYGHDQLWEPTRPVATAFFAIDGVGNVSAAPSIVTSLVEDRAVSWGGRLLPESVAVARTDGSSPPRRPLLTTQPTETWTPHGFEVKVAGPSGARRVWMRLCVEQQASRGSVPAHVATAVAETRDL